MISKRELAWLHALQSDLSIKRNWIAVGHLQGLIDNLADEYGLITVEEPRAHDTFVMH